MNEPSDPTRTRLIEAAGQEFAERGFEGATIRSICARAEANLAAVNYHFGDKERLYQAAVLEAHRQGCVGPEVLESLGEIEDPVEALRRFVGHMLRHVFAIRDDSWQHRLFTREIMAPTAACDTLVRERIRPRFEFLNRILARLSPELDESRRTAAAFSVIGQCIFYRMGRPITERLLGPEQLVLLDIEFLTDHITTFTLAALGQAPPIGGASGSSNRALDARGSVR
jgi:AcrR family transcriptional regulator